MARIVRREFMGNRFVFWILVAFPLAIPFAIIYFIESTVTVHEEVDEPEKFLDAFRAGKVGQL
ncbi:MAG: hypothetical protein HYR85_12370 [Planctomycetes bacterium]|nr:hypothetical protein [Planctomycetota bacterium]MBI3846373.1 hypothetical protein [Planctomycetota bacterium]